MKTSPVGLIFRHRHRSRDQSPQWGPWLICGYFNGHVYRITESYGYIYIHTIISNGYIFMKVIYNIWWVHSVDSITCECLKITSSDRSAKWQWSTGFLAIGYDSYSYLPKLEVRLDDNIRMKSSIYTYATHVEWNHHLRWNRAFTLAPKLGVPKNTAVTAGSLSWRCHTRRRGMGRNTP